MPRGNGVVHITKTLVLGLLVHFEQFIGQNFWDNFTVRLNGHDGSTFISQNS